MEDLVTYFIIISKFLVSAGSCDGGWWDAPAPIRIRRASCSRRGRFRRSCWETAVLGSDSDFRISAGNSSRAGNGNRNKKSNEELDFLISFRWLQLLFPAPHYDSFGWRVSKLTWIVMEVRYQEEVRVGRKFFEAADDISKRFEFESIWVELSWFWVDLSLSWVWVDLSWICAESSWVESVLSRVESLSWVDLSLSRVESEL